MEPEREWENWPGRGAPETRARGRLRALFTPTDEEELAIEAIIEARGRELEARTAELTSIVSDLQRREDETRRLRAAVEELLRDGAAELDERHAQLTALSTETARREHELESLEKALEERRQELGAVELRRAAVERREAHVDDRQTELDRLRDEIAERALELEGSAAEVERRRVDLEQQSSQAAALTVELERRRGEMSEREVELEALRLQLDEEARHRSDVAAVTSPGTQYADDEHVLVVPGAGYRFAYAAGPAPEPGRVLELDGLRYRVLRVGRSSLPDDRRASAFLERV